LPEIEQVPENSPTRRLPRTIVVASVLIIAIVAAAGVLLAVKGAGRDQTDINRFHAGHGYKYTTPDQRVTVRFPARPTAAPTPCGGCDPRDVYALLTRKEYAFAFSDTLVPTTNLATASARTHLLKATLADAALTLDHEAPTTFMSQSAYEGSGSMLVGLGAIPVRVEDFYVDGHVYMIIVAARQDLDASFDAFARSVQLETL